MVIVIFIFALAFCYGVIKMISNYFKKKRKPKPSGFNKDNPYIKYHKLKNKNDDHYEEYMKWLEKDGYGVPVEKVLTSEDAKANKKIKQSMRKRLGR